MGMYTGCNPETLGAEKDARIDELETALRPFARCARLNVRDYYPDDDECEIVMSVREMRAALFAMNRRT